MNDSTNAAIAEHEGKLPRADAALEISVNGNPAEAIVRVYEFSPIAPVHSRPVITARHGSSSGCWFGINRVAWAGRRPETDYPKHA